ncbi:MAG: phytanoyl-CoA dioxygenase family protein [Bacteroidota bacterium]
METMTSDLAKPYHVDAELSARYRHDGHILFRGVATPEEIDYYRPLITGLVDALAKIRQVRMAMDVTRPLFAQVTNIWQKSGEIEEFVFGRRFASIAAALMGVRGVRLYHDEAQMKEPGGYPTPWHKDHYNWPLGTHHTIKMWLALSDIRAEMGAARFATGTHRAGQFPEVLPSYEYDQLFERIIRTHKVPIVTYPMRAGDALFFSGEILHSALANTSSDRRETLAIIYFEDGTRVIEPNRENRRLDMEEFLPSLKPGDLAASPLNPVLYSSGS